MEAIVTGATGFTGFALCERLVRDGWKVSAFVRDSPRVGSLQSLGVECLNVDITDSANVKGAMRGVDCVFHIAALFRTEEPNREMFHRVNVVAAENVAKSAMEAGVGRYIHCSTVGVQGQIDDPPASETYRFKPNDHYQRTKLEGENVVRKLITQGLPGVVIRPAGIYGPGDLRFLKLFRAIKRNLFFMIGDGNTLYHLTFIEDLIDGFLLAAQSDKALGEVFTIAGPRYTTIREMVEIISRLLGKSPPALRVPLWPVETAAAICEVVCRPFKINPPLYPRRVEFFAMDRAFSIEKARRVLGYAPKVDLEDGMKATLAWYQENGFL